jgi:hypothetical protein
MLDGDVDVKNYGQVNVPMTDAEKNSPIPEPSFIPPPFVMDEDEDLESESPKSEKKQQQQPFNDNLDEMSASERTKSAEGMADVAIGLYSMGWKVLGSLTNVNLNKAREDHLEGKINLYSTIVLNGQPMTVEAAIIVFNKSSDGVFDVSEEFKEAVRPILIRILKKKGIGLTDVEELTFLVVMDIIQKAPAFIQLLKQRNKFYISAKKESINVPRQSTTPPQQTETPTAAPPNQDAAPSPLADNETLNVKKDGTVETIQIEEEDKPRRGRKTKPKV